MRHRENVGGRGHVACHRTDDDVGRRIQRHDTVPRGEAGRGIDPDDATARCRDADTPPGVGPQSGVHETDCHGCRAPAGRPP